MGEVYLAEDPRLGRNLAIKLLPKEIDQNTQRREQFISEAKAASALNHPNIITVYEIDQAEGAYYLATEFIGGITLRERMGNVGMPVREVMDISIQVSQGLAAAHAAGIVHRDIKPENIVIRPDGLAKIVDFGLAKVAKVDVHQPTLRTTMGLQSLPGLIVGTLGYMSPEQARGQDVDERTDIFSLGAMLYEMLAGQPAFHGETASDVLAAILTAQPKPLRQLAPEVPAKLERVVGRMMAKELQERYASLSELLAELTAVRKEWELDTETRRPRRRNPRTESGKIKSLAVLPFVSASADHPEAEYLSDGLTESLINSLSRLPHLKVISHSATLAYKGKPAEVKEVGRALKVQAVLTGRMVQQGDDISVSAELVNVRDIRQLWGSRYDRRISDVLSLQQEITRRVSEKLGLKVTADEQLYLKRHSTENKEAYQLYLKGRHWLGKRTREGQRKAMDYFTRAIELDPSYALAYDGLAQSYLLTFLPLAPRDRMPRAKAAAMKALEIDETIAEARISLARVKWQFDWDWPVERNTSSRSLWKWTLTMPRRMSGTRSS